MGTGRRREEGGFLGGKAITAPWKTWAAFWALCTSYRECCLAAAAAAHYQVFLAKYAGHFQPTKCWSIQPASQPASQLDGCL